MPFASKLVEYLRIIIDPCMDEGDRDERRGEGHSGPAAASTAPRLTSWTS